MAEDLGKKNRDFLKKFVSKDIVRKKGAYRLEEVKTEDPDQWKPRNFLQKLTPEQRRERREWAKEVKEEEKEKKRRKALRHPIEPPREFYKYQENKHGKPTKLSKKERDEIKNKVLVKTPLVKRRHIPIPSIFRNYQERKEEHEESHISNERKSKSNRTYKAIRKEIYGLKTANKLTSEKITDIANRIEKLHNQEDLITEHYDKLAEETMNLYFDITVD